jgi:hypothetical protein
LWLGAIHTMLFICCVHPPNLHLAGVVWENTEFFTMYRNNVM